MPIRELRAEREALMGKRKASFDKFSALAAKKDFGAADQPEYDRLHTEIKGFDAQIAESDAKIKRVLDAQDLARSRAVPVEGQSLDRIHAQAKSDPYEKDPSLVVGGLVRLAAKSRGDIERAFSYAEKMFGERHPVTEAAGLTKALETSVGTAGSFAIPPDFYDYIVPLLYAKTVVRQAGATVMPMPNGTMTISKLTAGMSAAWGLEASPIPASQQTFGQIAATARKLTALVPVSNDQMKYATPSFDGRVRDDLVMQISLAEDIAFIRSNGTLAAPKGLKGFVSSGNTITSTYAYTLSTVTNELMGLLNKLESANVPLDNVGWLMHPRTKNYLMGVQNSLGVFVYRDMMLAGKLFGYPYYTTTQIPTNLTINANPNCSEIYFGSFSQMVILESRKLELAVSLEGVYVDGNSVMQSAFQNDLTLVRGILSENFQMWHNEGVAFLQGVAWSPALQ